MAKAKLPSVAKPEVKAEPAPREVETKAVPEVDPPKAVDATKAELLISVPVLHVDDPSSHMARMLRVDVKRLTTKQSVAAKALLVGLKHKNARLENGKQVNDKRDVVAFLLESIHESMVSEGVIRLADAGRNGHRKR